MNQDTNNNTQNTPETNQVQPQQVNVNKVDPKTVQAEVLGHLRTEKIGNPSLLFAFLAIIAIVLILLPLATSMLQNSNSFLYKLIYKDDEVVEVDTPTSSDEFLDGTTIQKLSNSTSLKANDLVMKNFGLSQGQVECTIYSYNGILDLDEQETYLKIYSSEEEDSLIGYVKVTGNGYDSNETAVTLYNKSLSFNASHSYYGKIVTYTSDSDYPTYDAPADEYGIGSVTCTLDNRSIEYTFQNNYLLSIKDTDSYKVATVGNEKYLTLLSEFNTKADALGSDIASVIEEEEGFTYNANINLKGYTYPESVTDTNYYNENSLAKVIVYAEIGKGFDCE